MVDRRLTEYEKHSLMKSAYSHAMAHATDPSTQNGAILVNGYSEILASGANHFPRGVKETPERWQRPAKYLRVEHAERNCIYDAARRGVKTDGLIMVCPWAACSDCARAIIQAGIRHVISHRVPELDENGFVPGQQGAARWSETIEVAMNMFQEAHVRFETLEGKIDKDNNLALRRDGKIIHP